MIYVNVCAEGNDWLFGDLKNRFANTEVADLRVVVTDRPHSASDAWVFVRTREASWSPDLARSVVCIHDLYEHNRLYFPGGERAVVRHAGGLVLCHPEQRRILRDAGIALDRVAVLQRPLGALEIFRPRASLQSLFHLGWVGRDHWRKRPEWLVECAARLLSSGLPLRILLLGKELENLAAAISQIGLDCVLYSRTDNSIAAYPALYARMDCLLITSLTEAGPLPLFEALATGVPVAATPVGWAPHFGRLAPEFVRIGLNPAELVAHVVELHSQRCAMFERRHEIAALAAAPRLDTWFCEVLSLAKSLVVRPS